jgi:hypothetical protein
MTPNAPSYIIIGDVHGAIEELYDLLETVEPQVAAGAHLVFVGDYIDRGPDGPGVVKLVRNLVESGKASAVLGNHEETALRALKRGDPVDFDPADAPFLASLPVILSIPGGLVLHGGIAQSLLEKPERIEELIDVPFSSLTKKQKRTANQIMRTRVLGLGGRMVPLENQEDWMPFWSEVYDGNFGTVYFGHEMLAPPGKHAIPLDGGAAFGGVLRAAIHDSRTGKPTGLIDVPTRKVYASRRLNPPGCKLCSHYATICT